MLISVEDALVAEFANDAVEGTALRTISRSNRACSQSVD
jgi:hypothetical protein